MSCSNEALHTKPKLSRYVYYKLMTLIPVSAAVIGISRYAESWIWLGIYFGLCLSHALVMNAVKCPHCAYYKMGQNTFSCFMWWRMRRLYKPRAGPESRLVGIYAPIGMLILTITPHCGCGGSGSCSCSTCSLSLLSFFRLRKTSVPDALTSTAATTR